MNDPVDSEEQARLAAQRIVEERDAARLAAAQEIVTQGEVPEEQPMEPLNIAPEPEPVAPTAAEAAARPVQPKVEQVQEFAAAMDATAAMASQPAVDPTNPVNASKPVAAPRKSRAEIAAMRDAERNQGVDYWLPETEEWVKVRDIPFTDWVMLSGIPTELRDEIDAAIKDQNMRRLAAGQQEVRTLNEAVQTMGKAINMANGICISAFISPRLVLREEELEPGNDDIWLVSDLTVDERIAFMAWAQRERKAKVQANGGAAVVAGFPGPGI